MIHLGFILLGIFIGLGFSFVRGLIVHLRLRAELEDRAQDHGLDLRDSESTKHLAARLREHEILCEADALVDLMVDAREEPMPIEAVMLECAYRTGNVGEA